MPRPLSNAPSGRAERGPTPGPPAPGARRPRRPLHPLREKRSAHCEERRGARKVNRPPLCIVTGIPQLCSKEQCSRGFLKTRIWWNNTSKTCSRRVVGDEGGAGVDKPKWPVALERSTGFCGQDALPWQHGIQGHGTGVAVTATGACLPGCERWARHASSRGTPSPSPRLSTWPRTRSHLLQSA